MVVNSTSYINNLEMATWDGSYPDPDGSNYYRNQTSATISHWEYYNNTYTQNVPAPYTLNTMVFESSAPNAIPSMIQNAAHPNTTGYSSNEIHNNVPRMNTSETHFNDTRNQLPCFYEDNRLSAQQAYYYSNSNTYPNKKHNNTNENYQVSNVVEHSNLQATANEFIPKQNSKQFPNVSKNRYQCTADWQQNQVDEISNQPSNKIFFENNRVRHNDRKFENKRDSSKKGRETQNNQYYKEDKKDYGKNPNPRYYRNDRNCYDKNYCEKYQNYRSRNSNTEHTSSQAATSSEYEKSSNMTQNNSDKNYTQNSLEKQNVQSSNFKVTKNLRVCKNDTKSNEQNFSSDNQNVQSSGSQIIKNSRALIHNEKGDSYYNKKDKYNPRDPRDRKSNYSDYNSDLRDRRNNYTEHSTDYRERKSKFSDYNTDSKDRRNNHSDHNGGNREKRNNYTEHNDYQRENKFERNRESRFDRNNYEKNSKFERNNYSRDTKYERRENRNSFGENRGKLTDWRQRTNDTGNKGALLKRSYKKKYELDDDADQRERLTEQLNRGQLECLVCCEFIKQDDEVWSCKNCYHVLHLKCTQKWALSSQDETGWRCPACQNVTSDVPLDCECFCGKTRAPEWNHHDTAHSCGEICGRSRPESNCIHKCTLLCHPGSCPPCLAMITKTCGCGKTSQTQKCSTGSLLHCDAICESILNCGIHKCTSKCHHGSCEPCDKIVKQECYCGKHNREETCVMDLPPMYSCGEICDETLDCGNHKCKKICHPGECGSCDLKPESVTHCCCGQTSLSIERKSCLESIPTCDKICSKKLKCGQPSHPHTCQANCHEDNCPQCQLSTAVKCRCGYMDKEIPCSELTTKADDARCEKKCTKRRTCGKHKCNQKCCIDIEHICPLSCNKSLSCGRHKCEQTCHQGRCQPCWRSSFDELYCECGSQVIYPPVSCGTRRPQCDKPCTREHACDHEVLHNCHSDPICPPCTVLTQKWCYGRHELRKALPCYQNEISCGLFCNKPISCGRHKCILKCHPGPCEKPGQICVQPCKTPRELCGHFCAAPCHDGKCPDTPCKEIVKVTCQCGHRTMSRVCAENSRDYQRIATGILASKMSEMQLGHSVDLEEVFGQGTKKQNQLKTLECNEECKVIERNRKLTLSLQIVNPDLSGKLTPKYSEFMKQWGKKDPTFCQKIHDQLTELVQLSKTSKQKYRSVSFDCMNKEKRSFVHESCEHFGCESKAYDQEPKRNIVATAMKDKCWLPSYSLIELLQRENGQRKVPGPTLNKPMATTSERNKESLQLNSMKNLKPKPTTSTTPPKSPEPEIDYFNYEG